MLTSFRWILASSSLQGIPTVDGAPIVAHKPEQNPNHVALYLAAAVQTNVGKIPIRVKDLRAAQMLTMRTRSEVGAQIVEVIKVAPNLNRAVLNRDAVVRTNVPQRRKPEGGRAVPPITRTLS
jgi:hypothetical protein